MSIDDLLKKYEPELARAFLAGIEEITSKARIKEIVEALERGDVQAALDALYIDRAAYAEFELALEQAFADGGKVAVDDIGQLRDQSGSRFVFRFNLRNPVAERWLREHSSELITRIIQDQRDAIRNALNAALAQGRNPRSTALDVVGRINRRTGRREGGILGLSSPQERAIAKAREELSAGDYSAYLKRARRDKRFDRTIMKALREDRQLTSEEISRILNRYSDRLLKLRGEMISRTETLTALHAAQYQAVQQLIETGKVTADQVSLAWDATRDSRTRFDHAVADGQMIRFGETFKVGSSRMLYPGDPKGGPEQVVNCRCRLSVRVNYLANLR